MYLSIVAGIVGILFILFSFAGYVPGFFINNFLFGIFDVDPLQLIGYFVIGAFALLSALKYKTDRLFFQIVGIIFALLALIGFMMHGELLITHFNRADTIMHLILAILFLILGFATPKTGRV